VNDEKKHERMEWVWAVIIILVVGFAAWVSIPTFLVTVACTFFVMGVIDGNKQRRLPTFIIISILVMGVALIFATFVSEPALITYQAPTYLENINAGIHEHKTETDCIEYQYYAQMPSKIKEDISVCTVGASDCTHTYIGADWYVVQPDFEYSPLYVQKQRGNIVQCARRLSLLQCLVTSNQWYSEIIFEEE